MESLVKQLCVWKFALYCEESKALLRCKIAASSLTVGLLACVLASMTLDDSPVLVVY